MIFVISVHNQATGVAEPRAQPSGVGQQAQGELTIGDIVDPVLNSDVDRASLKSTMVACIE